MRFNGDSEGFLDVSEYFQVVLEVSRGRFRSVEGSNLTEVLWEVSGGFQF